MFSLICVWINDWVNNREPGDLRRHQAHCDVIVMNCSTHQGQGRDTILGGTSCFLPRAPTLQTYQRKRFCPLVGGSLPSSLGTLTESGCIQFPRDRELGEQEDTSNEWRNGKVVYGYILLCQLRWTRHFKGCDKIYGTVCVLNEIRICSWSKQNQYLHFHDIIERFGPLIGTCRPPNVP